MCVVLFAAFNDNSLQTNQPICIRHILMYVESYICITAKKAIKQEPKMLKGNMLSIISYSKIGLLFIIPKWTYYLSFQNRPIICHPKIGLLFIMSKWTYYLSFQNGPIVCHSKIGIIFCDPKMGLLFIISKWALYFLLFQNVMNE